MVNMGLIYVLLQFLLLVIAMATHPRWFSSPSMPAGPWHSGTTFWCTASPPPPRPRSGTGPGRLPGLRGSTSASLWAPHTSEPRARDQTKVHWATHSPRQNPNWPTHPAARLSWVSQSLRDDPSVLSTSLLVDYIWWEKDNQKSSVIVKKGGKKTTNPKQETVTVSDKTWLFLGIELRSVPAGSFSALSVTPARKHDLTCTNFGDVGWEEKVSLHRGYKQALGSATSLLSLLPLSGWPRPLTPAHFHSAEMRRAALWKRSGRAAHRGTVR